MFNKFFIALFLLVCFSCQDSDNTNAVADDVCRCFTPLVELNDKIQSHLKKNQGAAAERLLPQVKTEEENGKKCFGSLLEKYGAETELNSDKLSQNIKNKCPKIHSILKLDQFGK